MKTFNDLEFTPHKVAPNSVAAYMKFPNGTFISVVGGEQGCGLYGNGQTSFEILSSVSERKWQVVEGWLSKEKVTSRMRYLQTLKSK